MKLLVFGHLPPPLHGQSLMIQAMLDGIGRIPDWELFHVNVQLSNDLADLGKFRPGKVFKLLACCLQALWLRFRHGIETFYYVPAPATRTALYRDWIVMAICRPFFPRLILHWHAIGLTMWLDREGHAWERALTQRLLGRAQLSIAVANASSLDAANLNAQQIAIVPNGIPDPMPDFEPAIANHRHQQWERRQPLLGAVPQPGDPANAEFISLLYLSQCTERKGIFCALDLIIATNRRLKEKGARGRLRLEVAGELTDALDSARFAQLCQSEELKSHVRYHGWADPAKKRELLLQADAFCFLPVQSESFGLVLLEAMAAGLPILGCRAHAIPEILGSDYPGLIDPTGGDQPAQRLLALLSENPLLPQQTRQLYLQRFTLTEHLSQMNEALGLAFL